MVKVGEINKEEEDYIMGFLGDDGGENDVDHSISVLFNFLEENSFEKPMSRKLAEMIIEDQQGVELFFGGKPLHKEKSFLINNIKYTVIAWGVTESVDRPANQETSIRGLIVIKEE